MNARVADLEEGERALAAADEALSRGDAGLAHVQLGRSAEGMAMLDPATAVAATCAAFVAHRAGRSMQQPGATGSTNPSHRSSPPASRFEDLDVDGATRGQDHPT